MHDNNAVIIPRNQHVEDALSAAQEGNLTLFHALLEAVQNPYAETESNVQFRLPPAHAHQNYQTFCVT